MLLLAFLACAPKAPAAAEPKFPDKLDCEPARWPEAVRTELLAAWDRGTMLARRDAYAWQATDRLVEASGGGDPMTVIGALGVRGYVIEETSGTSAVVHWVAGEPAEMRDVAVVRFDEAHPDGVAERLATPVPAAPAIVARFVAAAVAKSDARFVPKTERYNIDVVPWGTDPADGWAVYLLAGALDMNAVPFGGGYLAHVDAPGTHVLSVTPLSNTVLTVPVKELHDKAGTFVASLVTPMPDASVVAFAMIWGVPMLVSAGNSVVAIGAHGMCWGAMEG